MKRALHLVRMVLLVGSVAVAKGAEQPVEPRLALVMGVGDYAGTKFPTLPGIDVDLQRMETALKAAGFQVTVVPNPTLVVAEDAIETFGAKLKAQGGGVGLFYFSGHGGEFEGKNYLIPKGARISGIRDIKEEAVAAQRVLNRMEDAGARVNIVFLDCCRNDLTKSATGTGLAPMNAKGTFIGFATGTDKSSLAGSEGSPYTTFLAKRLLTPGVSILDMHTQVTADVEDYTKSNGADEQTPFQYSGLRSSFYFVPGTAGNTEPPKDAPTQPPVQMARLATPEPPPPEMPKVEPALPPASSKALEKATKNSPFVNSLGMEFVPVPGTKVLFCKWHTRVRDWQEYVQAEGDPTTAGIMVMRPTKTFPGYCVAAWQPDANANWKNPGFAQKQDHPVCGVSWDDAQLFCAWLSKKEGRTYRLPKDAEWSAAVGPGKYPWGNQWPPPKGAGNYGDEAFVKTLPGKTFQVPGNDGYARTSPVGSFAPNRYGIYDMGGNLWQLCEDVYHSTMNDHETLTAIPFLLQEKGMDGLPCRVTRGGSWDGGVEIAARSVYHAAFMPGLRSDNVGFRVVVEISGR